MKQENLNKFCDIMLNMSNEILDKLGQPLIEDGYYNDKHYGDEYVYNKLTINRNMDGNIQIYIDNENVFYYDVDKKAYGYSHGVWPQLIMAIYEQIPAMVKERKLKEKEKQNRINDLKLLSEYFKNYIILTNKKTGIKEIINSELNDYNISIIKDKRVKYTTNPIQCYEEEHIYYEYVVYYNNQKVAEFGDNEFNVFPNYEYYAQEYIPGEWTKALKQVISKATITNEALILKQLDNTVDDMIKTFRKTLKSV